MPLDRSRRSARAVRGRDVHPLFHARTDRTAQALTVKAVNRASGFQTSKATLDRVDVDRRPPREVGSSRRAPTAARRASASGSRLLSRNCTRYSPRSLPSGAGAGPSTRNARPAGSIRCRSCCTIARRIVHRRRERSRAHDGVDERRPAADSASPGGTSSRAR